MSHETTEGSLDMPSWCELHQVFFVRLARYVWRCPACEKGNASPEPLDTTGRPESTGFKVLVKIHTKDADQKLHSPELLRFLVGAVSPSLESRWISVKDRMPEPGRDVLIFVLDEHYGHKNYQVVDCYDEQASPEEWDEVTHWMELPAAPPATETQPHTIHNEACGCWQYPPPVVSNGIIAGATSGNTFEFTTPRYDEVAQEGFAKLDEMDEGATETAPQSQNVFRGVPTSQDSSYPQRCEKCDTLWYANEDLPCPKCSAQYDLDTEELRNRLKELKSALREKEAELATANRTIREWAAKIETIYTTMRAKGLTPDSPQTKEK